MPGINREQARNPHYGVRRSDRPGGTRTNPSPEVISMAEMKNLSGLTDEQAKEFHEHWKHGVWSWVMIATVVHVVTWVYQPWF
jgi:light-harvesting complex 1 beta chain